MAMGRSSILVCSSAQDSLATWWPLDRHRATIRRVNTWPVRWNCNPVMISLEVMCCRYTHIFGIVQMLTVYNLSLPLPMIALFLSVTFLVNLFLMPFSFPFFLTSVCVGPPWTGRGRLAALIWTCPLCINALSLEFFIYWPQAARIHRTFTFDDCFLSICSIFLSSLLQSWSPFFFFSSSVSVGSCSPVLMGSCSPVFVESTPLS